MDKILLFKEDLDQYKTSELVALQQHFGLSAAHRDDLVWMLAIYQAENNHQGKMTETGVSERMQDSLFEWAHHNNIYDEINNVLSEKVTHLILNDNGLTNLPPGIGLLTNLKTLYLNGNEFVKLPAEIGLLTNLTTLALNNNNITELLPQIGKLAKLTYLGLNYNQLVILPPQIGLLTKLEILGLNDNELTELPAQIGQLENLTHLQLNNNQLKSLPAEIGQLKRLQELDLDDNQLTDLPAEIRQLTHLQVLELGSNQLTEFPAEIGELTDLQVLNLGDNQLKSLPAEIGQLADLQRLYLWDNQLTELPDEIGKLTNLEELDLDDNELPEDVPKTIQELQERWERVKPYTKAAGRRANMRRHRGTMNGGKEEAGLASWAAESLWRGVSETTGALTGAATDVWYPPPEGATTCRDVRDNFESLVAHDRHLGRFFALIVEASKPISYKNMSPKGIEEVLEQRVELLDMTRNAKSALDVIPVKDPRYRSSKQLVLIEQRWKDLEYYLFNMFPGGTCKGRETELTCSLCTYFLAALEAVPKDSMDHFIELYNFYTDYPTMELWDVTEAERARLRKTIEDIKTEESLIKVW